MKNKIIVITGGSSGLGKDLAQLFISKGDIVVICARNKAELEKVSGEINATPFVADVTKASDMKSLADFTISSFGRIDVWINNAGVWMPHGPFVKMDVERIRRMFEVNVFGAMHGSQAALMQMQAQEEGIIANIISTSALLGRPTSSGYAASKWAVRGFTDSIRGEYKETKIKIIGIYPGGMQTHLFDEQKPDDLENYMTSKSVAKKIVENLEQENPLEEQIIKRPPQ